MKEAALAFAIRFKAFDNYAKASLDAGSNTALAALATASANLGSVRTAATMVSAG